MNGSDSCQGTLDMPSYLNLLHISVQRKNKCLPQFCHFLTQNVFLDPKRVDHQVMK